VGFTIENIPLMKRLRAGSAYGVPSLSRCFLTIYRRLNINE